jgi:hypothetical protein
MRQVATVELIRRFMSAVGSEAPESARVYFTGGATAVLLGFRETTIDVDLRFYPDRDWLLRLIPALKESLQLNLELAAPSDFIPELSGWEDRSLFIAQEGPVSFFHYDLYSQALAKAERGHAQDLTDIAEMLARGLIEPAAAREFFEAIEPELYRYPAVDPASFRRAVQKLFRATG